MVVSLISRCITASSPLVTSSLPPSLSLFSYVSSSRGLGLGLGPGSWLRSPLVFTRGMAKKKGRVKDKRVRMIRYALNHPATPRPLRFGTLRWLRHWTIHRAWQLYRRRRRTEQQVELQRQWDQMRLACDELAKADQRLFRIATAKKDVAPFPPELRIPTQTPPRDGWNHAWKRPVVRTKGRVSR